MYEKIASALLIAVLMFFFKTILYDIFRDSDSPPKGFNAQPPSVSPYRLVPPPGGSK